MGNQQLTFECYSQEKEYSQSDLLGLIWLNYDVFVVILF